MVAKGITKRLLNVIDRWGLVSTLAFAAIFLAIGLGRSGLWDPWEMDRADLARSLSESPLFLVATVDPGVGGLLDSASEQAKVVLHREEVSDSAKTGKAKSQRTFRVILDEARTQVLAGLVFDLKGIGLHAFKKNEWIRTWRNLKEASAYVPNGQVILLIENKDMTEQSVLHELAVARIQATWQDMQKSYRVKGVRWPDSDDAFWLDYTGDGVGIDNVVLLAQPQVDTVAVALEEAGRVGGHIVRFKELGQTFTVPPLQHWMTAACYRLFGISEASTRLSGVLLAWLTLALFLVVCRRRIGLRPALLAGLVMLTMPSFLAQARSAVGEPGAILGFTLVVIGLWGQVWHEGRCRVWSWLLAGLLVTFLAKGLTGLLVAFVMIAAVPIVMGERRLSLWLPTLATGFLFALLTYWVQSSLPHTFASHFRFISPFFTEGPPLSDRNFDHILKRLGFGLYPWSPILVVALAHLMGRIAREKDRVALVFFLGFVVPTIAAMGLLRDYNHAFLWASPAAALIVAFFLEDLWNGRAEAQKAAGFVLWVMGAIIAKELSENARPVADLLAFDPPFLKESGHRFPEEVSLGMLPWAVFLLAIFPLGLHLTQTMAGLRRLTGFFRRQVPCSLALGVLCLTLPSILLARVVNSYVMGMRLDSAKALSASQRAYPTQLFFAGDPLAIVAWTTLILLLLVVLIRYLILKGRYVVKSPDFSRMENYRHWVLRVGAATWTLVGVHLFLSVTWPENYWSETLQHPELGVLCAVAFGVAWACRLSGFGKLDCLLSGVSIIGLGLGTRLARDASLMSPWAIGFSLSGCLAYGVLVLPKLWNDGTVFMRWAGGLGAGALFLWVLPLLQRWEHMSPLLYPDGQESLTRYLFLGSRVTWLIYIALGCLVLNRWLPDGVRHRIDRVGHWTVRGPIVAGSSLLAAMIFAIGTVFIFFPTLAHHVSQKHIVDSYRTAEGLEGAELEQNIFKHGSFASSGRKEVNFYTASIPEIRDRKLALSVLAAGEDTGVRVTTSVGSESIFLPGWNEANDRDVDGQRDWVSESGFASEVGQSRLVDNSKQWVIGAYQGKVLIDATGREWPIVSNDATALELKGPGTPAFSNAKKQQNSYVIDDPGAVDHRATSQFRVRRYLLLPVASFSELNHQFRKQSSGRHLPILDGRSSRVLLATSWLEEGEENQNRFAQHTLTKDEFDNLEVAGLHRVWANFGDKLRVVGYRLRDEAVSQGKKLQITLYIEALADIRTSYKIFQHIDRQGSTNRIHGDHWPLNLAVEGDAKKKCVSCYRSNHWLKGDVIVDVYEQEVPIGTSSGLYDIWFGLFNPTDDKRLPVRDWERGIVRHDGSDRVRLGTLQVR